MTKSIIIGAGLGGLSCAVLLAAHGHDVSRFMKKTARPAANCAPISLEPTHSISDRTLLRCPGCLIMCWNSPA
ncbi:NAD(P)-binding protein [Sinobaca sp. H24]|uniref:NAD(P)-binding protein n=1 Tax=Sinobaca sp. H24 TaxID=2923376 RepID=UPI0027E23E89|nr:NAD(P)-binding protein [Sinobaca sp. H24]